MSSIVKMSPGYKPLGITPEYRSKVASTDDNLGVLIPGKFIILSGEDSGKEVTDGIVRLNQVIKIEPSIPLQTNRYTILVGYNPLLGEVGSVSCPSILPPGVPVSMTIKAYRNFEIAQYTDMYSFIIYALD